MKIMEQYKESNKFKLAVFAILPFGTVYKIISGMYLMTLFLLSPVMFSARFDCA
jgi:hypothetical protein